MAYLSSFKSKLILTSFGIIPLKFIFGILIISVINDLLVPNPNAPCPTRTETFLFANFNKIF